MNPDITIVETGAQKDEEKTDTRVNPSIPLQVFLREDYCVKTQLLFRKRLQQMRRRWMKVEKKTDQTARLPKPTKRSQNLTTSSAFVREHPRL